MCPFLVTLLKCQRLGGDSDRASDEHEIGKNFVSYSLKDGHLVLLQSQTLNDNRADWVIVTDRQQ